MESFAVLNLLLADDDCDDCFFFGLTLEKIKISTHLETVGNGRDLMIYLHQLKTLPDVLFLDFNMPMKNGAECLAEINSDSTLRDLPVIMYSTSIYADVAEKLYQMGAYYYIRKSNLTELQTILIKVLSQMSEKKFVRPLIENFILSNERVFQE